VGSSPKLVGRAVFADGAVGRRAHPDDRAGNPRRGQEDLVPDRRATARAGAQPGQRVHAGVALQVDEVTAGHVTGDVEVEPVQSGPAGEKAARVVDIVLTVHGRTLVPPAPIDVHTATVPHRDPCERTNMQLIFGAGPQAVVLAAVRSPQ